MLTNVNKSGNSIFKNHRNLDNSGEGVLLNMVVMKNFT